MKIFTAEEMRALDESASNEMEVPSRVLMENAGRVTIRVLFDLYEEILHTGVLVLCGGGNNGGDGFVVARSLLQFGIDVDLFCLKPTSELVGDSADNARAFLAASGKVRVLENTDESIAGLEGALARCGVVVDALFGTGLNGGLSDFPGEVVKRVNNTSTEGGCIVVSVDIPSGVDADTGLVGDEAIIASTTIALQALKPGHVVFPGASYCGEVLLADIGVPTNTEFGNSINRELITESGVSAVIREAYREDRDLHKGQRGHVMIVGGSEGMYGAPKMSGLAALRAGSGLVTLLLPNSACYALSPILTELMCIPLEDDDTGDFSGDGLEVLGELLRSKRSVVLGPGMGETAGASDVVAEVLSVSRRINLPVVIDADGLNVISANSKLREFLSEDVVLTPHPGEMARLLGVTTGKVQYARIEAATTLSEQLKCWVVLKGARTVIAGPKGEVFVNPAATPVLATAGSGDVLAGVIGGFLGRGFTLSEASAVGVFVHGCAGEVLEYEAGGPAGVIASDIIEVVPRIINFLIDRELSNAGPILHALPGSFSIAEYVESRGER